MGGTGEVVENLAPGGVFGGAASVAFVDHHEVEEIAGKLLVDILLFFVAGHGLIQRQVDFVGLFDLPFGNLSHRLAEGLEVVVLGLVDEDVAVGEEEDAFLLPRLPQAPDDLEGRVGLAGAGGHDQQDAILPARHGLNGTVDGVHLVVARHAPGAVVVIRGFGLLLAFAAEALPLTVALPQLLGAGELPQAQLGFLLRAGTTAIMEEKTVTVAGEHERQIQRLGITERLLHSSAEGMLVVLGFDNSQRQVGLVIQDVVCATRFAPAVQLATDDDAALGKADFLTDLLVQIPASCGDGRRDVFAADVTLSQ
ncbi:hypothetical protein D3C81_1368350 [compost metagenome]